MAKKVILEWLLEEENPEVTQNPERIREITGRR